MNIFDPPGRANLLIYTYDSSTVRTMLALLDAYGYDTSDTAVISRYKNKFTLPCDSFKEVREVEKRLKRDMRANFSYGYIRTERESTETDL